MGGVSPLPVIQIKALREYKGGYSVTKYVSENCETRKFGALLVAMEAQTKWKVLKCEKFKIADDLHDIFDHKSVQLFPEKISSHHKP